MGSLDDTLRLEASETSPLAGETPFASAVRPTASGLQWLAVPSAKAGLAYRIVGGASLERLDIGEGVSIAAATSIHAPATHICTCFDGRLVAVTCIDGSMECFDSTSSGLESRWIITNCHSHFTNDLSVPPSSDRSKAASASGPVSSFSFAPSSYELMLVDALKGSLAIYNAVNAQPTNELTHNAPSGVLSASWSTSSDVPVLAFGNEDGSIEICRYQDNSLAWLKTLECPHEEEDFCCTHLDWSKQYLLVGLCKVNRGDEEADEEDEDDTAEHEAAMYMTSMDMASFSPGEWHELGDVVPFFSVPRSGRHAFFSFFVHPIKHPLCVVAANVGTDVAVLAEEDGSWAVIEFEEGNEPTTPTDDEDEFSFPIGVGVVPLASGFFQLLLPTTDGSLSTFTFRKEDEPEAVKVVNILSTDLEDGAVEMIEAASPPDLAEEPPVPGLAGKISSTQTFGAGYGDSFSFVPTTIAAPSTGDDKPIFGFGGSASSNTTFGSTSTFGGGGFGQPSTLGGGSSGTPEAKAASISAASTGGDKPVFGGSISSNPTFGGSAFGQTSSKFGGGGFGQPSTLGGSSAESPEAKAAPVLEATATLSSGPVFGSGTKAGISGGFAALSASPPSSGFGSTFSDTSTKKPFYSEPSAFASPPKKGEAENSAPQAFKTTGSQTPSTATPAISTPANTSDALAFGSGSKAPSFTFGVPSASPFAFNTTSATTPAESPFNAFSSSKTSPSQGFMAKPLFGTKKEQVKVTESEKPLTPKAPPVVLPTADKYSAAGKSAARVFDTLDEEKAGALAIDSFENLSEELGEGFHGDEYDKQITIIDPSGSGFIQRTAFIDWYTELVEGDDNDGSSIDSDERAEREEEREKALAAFQNLSGGNDTIPETDFQRLIESLNTVYCAEEHRKTLKIIARGGEIHELDFLSWYVGWLFGGDESSDEEEYSDTEASAGAKNTSSKSGSLGAMFSVDKDSWKCEICSVRNNGDSKKCLACESVRPGFEDDVAKAEKAAAESSGSAIGSSGFSFGGSSSSGGIGAGGFAFGAPAPISADSGISSGGGFTFGAPAPASGGFTFGAPKSDAPKPLTESGFTFGGPAARVAATTPKSDEAGTGFHFTPAKLSTANSDQSLSDAGKSAARVFDTIDEEKGGSLPIDSFENLSEELGEGFHGDEYDKQIAIIDPNRSGKITRTAFIDWYTELVEGDDDDGSSINSEEKAEREEERQKAQDAFQDLSGRDSTIPASDFQKLVESMNTVYCEEEHRKTLKKITKDGKIKESDFLSWYVDWLFGGDESTDEEDDDDDAEASAGAKDTSSKSGSLGAMFSVDKDSWKCEICSVRNNGDSKKCLACESVRPGFEDDVAKAEKAAAESSGSAIGSGGFSFGGSSSSGGIGAGGFAFGAPAPISADSGISSGGGFTFGAPAPASGGFTFGAPKSDAPKPLTESPKLLTDTKPANSDQGLSDAGKSAARIFDTLDEEKGGSLPIDSFENLSEELGEGFHGDEYDKQIAIIDPNRSGKITRTAFIDWYTELVEGDDDDGSSINSEEKAEREEERQKAQDAFQDLSGRDSTIPASDFQKLVESMNTVYCEEEHRKTLKKITKDGKIKESDFLSWYVDWLFGGDESTDEEDDDDDAEASAGAKDTSSKSGSLGAMFSVDKDSWKCEICSVRNNGDSKKCLACESVRPGFEDDVAKAEKAAAESSGSAIGSGGFSFGGSSSSGGIGAGGFAFGAPAPISADSGISSGGGFTFGAPQNDSPSNPVDSSATTATTSTSSAAFPPMSTKAPTPFSAKKKPPASGATESKPANPFSGISLVPSKPLETAAKKATVPGISAAFPPMSSKAPTPFGGGQVKATTSTSSATFPPMSTNAPTPFSAKTTPASGATESKPTNPFSGVSLVTTKPLETAAKKTIVQGSSAAFPPMSTKAPTPFGGGQAKATTSTSSAAFPPMSTKAPTPFGGGQAKATTSFIGKAASGISQSQLSAAPMTTVSTFGGPSTKAATPDSSAAFPPMSAKAPTPFGGGQAKTLFSASSSTTNATKVSSGSYPHVASKAPTLFGVGNATAKAQASVGTINAAVAAKPPSQLVAQSATKQNDRLGIGKLRSSLSQNTSDAGIKFVELTTKMEEMLYRVGGLQGKTELDGDFEDRIQSMVDRVQSNRASLTASGTSIGSQRQTNTFLLSRKVDSERQVREAARLVNLMMTESPGEKLADTQPLDYQSEMNRRKFAAAAVGVVGQMKLAKEKLQLLEVATQSSQDGSWMLATGVIEQYKRTNAFKQRLDRIEGKLDRANRSLPLQEKQRIEKSRTGQSTYGLTMTPRKQRPRPIPLAEALTPLSKLTGTREQNGLSAQNWGDMASSLQEVGSQYSRTVRVSGTSSLKTLRGTEPDKPAPKAPSVVRSLLLSPSQERPYSALPQSSSASSSTSITIFSPKPRTKTKTRSGWDTVSTLDQAVVQKLSFSVSGELKEATLADASRKKLDRFGTTPEKVKQSIDIKKNQSAFPTPTRSKELATETEPKTQLPKKEVSSAALPPMSSKAPINPFSKTAQKSSDSKPPMKPKQATSYPPISAVAPKPFTDDKTGTSSSSAVPNKETPPVLSAQSATKTDPFSTASMGSSLFSSGVSGSTPSPFGAKPTSDSVSKASGAPDYNAILIAFYQKHNPAKVAEVAKTLEKYRGREVEMFQKLASKYKVKSPLDESQSMPATTPGFANASAAKSPFGSAGAPASNTAASPFQSSGPSNTLGSASPFSSGGAMNTASTFGKPPASPFGPAPGAGTMVSSTPFGSSAPPSTPFGGGGLSSATPFGGAPSPSPFGPAAAPTMQPAGVTQNTLQGKDPREMLMQFYQQYNPNKLGEVDKVLTKYKGQEEQLFRNLAKKYSLDPSAFGLPPAPTAVGFGSPAPAPASFGQASSFGAASTSTFGGSSGFGQPSQMGFGSPGAAGSSTAFGSGMSGAQGTSSFGSLAQSPSPSPFGNSSMGGGGFGSPAPAFGAPSSMGFGGGSTPFGAARR
ncbi:unnamed protein product [Cylindrotheca closterium]|uniref:Nuclear pore complex protein Nup153 n=1 Tax=Cylindrotheca closterium TaxID=2856 RepID=A0AAD2FVW9_9STRA|nr:unnamed protein product [Cylindrotheca closterium]